MKRVLSFIVALVICAGMWMLCDYLIPNHIGVNLLEDVVGYHNDDYRFSLGIHDTLSSEKVSDRSYIIGTVLNDNKYFASDVEYKLSTEAGGYLVAIQREKENSYDVVREDGSVDEATVFVPDENGNIELHFLQSQVYKFHNISRKSIRPIVSPTVSIEYTDNYINENAGTISQKFTVKYRNLTEGIRFNGESPWVVVVLWVLMTVVFLVFMWPVKCKNVSGNSNKPVKTKTQLGSIEFCDIEDPVDASFEPIKDSDK